MECPQLASYTLRHCAMPWSVRKAAALSARGTILLACSGACNVLQRLLRELCQAGVQPLLSLAAGL